MSEAVKPVRMPVAFVPHGGGPITHVELGMPKADVEALGEYWRSLRALPPVAPRALLVISAHWEERVPTVMSSPHPPMLYDYYGFPEEAYQITWPAPGDPALAERVRELLSGAGFTTAEDPLRGFDHGTFTPLKQTYPEANVPVVQLSLQHRLDAAEHLAMGRALVPLRDEGVFIIGSGDTFHNLRELNRRNAYEKSLQFDAWLKAAVTSDAATRDERLTHWTEGPFARYCHPREDHLVPLMVIAGAAGNDAGVVTWSGVFIATRQTGYHFGGELKA
jgi:aromatic ring-opening dioxygenase catalytic subunit (LigB family)